MMDEHSAAVFSIPQEYTLLSRTLLAEHISQEIRDRHLEEICYLQKIPGVLLGVVACTEVNTK